MKCRHETFSSAAFECGTITLIGGRMMKGLIFPLFVLSWLVGFVWMLLYVRQLKKRYPKLHADIFRDPFQKKIRNDWRLFVFLASAKYRGAVDLGFGRQSDFLRYYIFTFFAMMALAVYALATL